MHKIEFEIDEQENVSNPEITCYIIEMMMNSIYTPDLYF